MLTEYFSLLNVQPRTNHVQQLKTLYLAKLMARCYLTPNRPYHAAHIDRAGRRVYSPGDSICQYWKHFATQTVSHWPLAHMCTVRHTLQWFNLLSIFLQH